MPKIAETYEEIIAAAKGEIKAIVTTAEVWQIFSAPTTAYKPLDTHFMQSCMQDTYTALQNATLRTCAMP